ncbi:hypothetical protein KY328_04575 [Candidatus Woesearchaeota archaeon]|nr:hypothetical protein [Candidatus Woesearchaeota archaeon]MBW3022174.1 hypothetical protein [Candidatus Woesearchaeota archaeon]
MQRIRTGVIGLDNMLGGGIPKGRTVLVSGNCGSGKTMLASQFINHGFHKNEPGIYVTLEQGKLKLFEDAKEIGIDFKSMEKAKKVKIIGGSIGTISKFKFKTRAKAFDLIEEIKEVIDEVKAKRAVIDSVNLFAMLFNDEEERRQAVASLISMLEDSGCTTLLTCEVPEKSDQISWYGFEDFVVDGVIFLHRCTSAGSYQRAVSIVKMRGTKHAQNIQAVEIKNKGLVVYDHEADFVRF